MVSESVIPIYKDAEGEVHATMNGFIRVLEDIGYLKKIGVVYEIVDATLSDNRRSFLKMIHGSSRKVYRLLVTPFYVEWFDDVYNHMYVSGTPVEVGAIDQYMYTR
jgi:hypothetical protein